MLRHVCPACKNGSHRACWGTKHPPKNMMGGSTCICTDRVHKDPNFRTIYQDLTERKAPGMEAL